MRIDLATLFPAMCESVLNESILGRARKAELVELHTHDIREYTLNKHRRVDDAPYGGGMGMLMQADPIYRCYEAICEQVGTRPHVIYMSPQGQTLTQAKAVSLSKLDNILLLCGHYEGVDERIIEEIVDEEISIGDYVLTGGELSALVVVDSVVRLLDGVLPSSECFENESHYNGLLEYPQYTRPEVWHDKPVPEVLMSGHHANIEKWRREMSVLRTAAKRPDLLEKADLTEQERSLVESMTKK
ncbi:tRNA (guanine-N(1)-)-methyltransferase [[Clostridium] methylpentosum DSM 5476]|uniref:tRNA (guanine-N(1)-)-methyltransferase n=1 Tax=[Clostridium] methylpentosum DSM 5476 TaxID=537013 RepID=C0EEZ1_9FIRM|nr:tRNA (guanine-N(1)-)-methyltransferase [[Clostridium] methylpentosum DSM 5476]MDY3988579.1 tRNA (guanosine(37)-N1)-methyltransferase TrmD [Massilioclostridium sp.]MEE1492079.1 tRNA (guanosine(37)-N1)-methyltransferase TrmD [Massilioclostridium sp.]